MNEKEYDGHRSWHAIPHADEAPYATIVDISDYPLQHYRVRVTSLRHRSLGHVIVEGRRRPIRPGDEFELDRPPSIDVLHATFEPQFARSWWREM